MSEKLLFASDLHGNLKKYELLFELLAERKPRGLFLGGDLFSRLVAGDPLPFFRDFLEMRLERLRRDLDDRFPAIFVIPGNDDPRALEELMQELEKRGLWSCLNMRVKQWSGYLLAGYCYIPPSPFLLKDWERYDVSRFLDIGSVAPEEGIFTYEIDRDRLPFQTIKEDLEELFSGVDLERALLLFHAPPYNSSLDLADLAGKMVDHAPLDPHIGSIAIRDFIEERRPLLTMHGHVHESYSLTGTWKERIGQSWCYSAAAPGPELAVVEFDPADPASAERLSFSV